MRAAVTALILLLAPMLAPAAVAQTAEQTASWRRPAEPFRMIGDVWYVGTEGLAAYLVTDPAGHVLIDGALPESAPLIAANIRKLGFRLRNIRILLNNHAHYDHSGGLAELKRLSGAKLWASAGDKHSLESGRTIGRPELPSFPPVKVDRVVADGDKVTLGGIVLTALLTPGHTPGCTSWSLRTHHAGHSLDVTFACSLTVAGERLQGDPAFPDAAAAFRESFTRLRNHPAEVFLNFHPESYDLKDKRARQKAGEELAFVDPGELGRHVDEAERAFEAELARQAAVPPQ